jgi:methylmalonyl-CoA mutase N-terminal domain/subunit
LTSQIEDEVLKYIEIIDKMGGSIKAIESGYFKREIAKTAYGRQMEIERNERIVVGSMTILRKRKRKRSMSSR